MAKIIEEKTLYEGYLYLKKAKVEVPGINRSSVTKTFEMFGRGDSVAALVYNTDSDSFILVKQYRYPAEKDGGMVLEIVAGGIEEESPEESIKREVLEEIGYDSKNITPIGKMYVSPGRTDERLFLYFIEVNDSDKRTSGGGLEEEQEDIEVVTIEREEFYKMLKNNELIDAKTIIAAQHYFMK